MYPKPIALQLWSVRQAVQEQGLPRVLETVSRIGYRGIEWVGTGGFSPSAARRVLDDCGLVSTSCHGPFPTAENIRQIADIAGQLGYTLHIVPGYGPEHFASPEAARRAGERFEAAAQLAAEQGLTLGYHNHEFEFAPQFDGRPTHYDFLAAAPSLKVQLDTYWVAVGRFSPVAAIRHYQDRLLSVHIKDGPLVPDALQVAVGQGQMDWASIFPILPEITAWIIVELDDCAGDMLDALAASYAFLLHHGYVFSR